MTQHPKIYVADHRGMVGAAIVRVLHQHGHYLGEAKKNGYNVNVSVDQHQ